MMVQRVELVTMYLSQDPIMKLIHDSNSRCLLSLPFYNVWLEIVFWSVIIDFRELQSILLCTCLSGQVNWSTPAGTLHTV